jgi:hypothetical protein
MHFDNTPKLDGSIDNVPVSKLGKPPGYVWVEKAKRVGNILEQTHLFILEQTRLFPVYLTQLSLKFDGSG